MTMLRLGVFGRGRLGSAIAEACCGEEHLEWQLGRGGQVPAGDVEVAVDASMASAVPGHLEWAITAGVPLVIAATGWRLDDLAERVGDNTGVVVAPNGSLTVALLARLARLLGGYARTLDGAEGWLLDHHHAGKRDAPSGTALRLAAAYRSGAGAEPPVASLRAGHQVGHHVLGLDAPGEVVELHHRALSRAPFAHGLLAAARWLRGRRGVFTMDDVVSAVLDPIFAQNR